jgi:hypothetical protein
MLETGVVRGLGETGEVEVIARIGVLVSEKVAVEAPPADAVTA